MRTLVVYDSIHGNTAKIAQAIGNAISDGVSVRRADELNTAEVKSFDLLIVGSPTHGGQATKAIQDVLNKVSEPVLQGTKVATFDTRFSTRLVRLFGYAAPRIADILKKKGGNLLASPEAFFVKGTKGPLKEGELEHAARWAKEIIESARV